MTITHTPATIIEDLIVAIEMTREAEADVRNALATRVACAQAVNSNPYFPAAALEAAEEELERAECEVNYNYDELAMALAAGRAFVAAA